MRYECRTVHNQVQTHSRRINAPSLNCFKDTYCDEKSRWQQGCNLNMRAQGKKSIMASCLTCVGRASQGLTPPLPSRQTGQTTSDRRFSSFKRWMYDDAKFKCYSEGDILITGHKNDSKFTLLTWSAQLSLNVAEGPTPPSGSSPAEHVAARVDGDQHQAQHGDVAKCPALSFLGVWPRKENVNFIFCLFC